MGRMTLLPFAIAALSAPLSVLSSFVSLPEKDVQVCWKTASSVPPVVTVNGAATPPNDLLSHMSSSLCAKSCYPIPQLERSYQRVSSGLHEANDCETSVLLSPDLEAFIYRGGNTTIQHCHEVVGKIITDCIKNGPNTGISLGVANAEFYEAGFRDPKEHSALAMPKPAKPAVEVSEESSGHSSAHEAAFHAEKVPILDASHNAPNQPHHSPPTAQAGEHAAGSHLLQNVVAHPHPIHGSGFCDKVRSYGTAWYQYSFHKLQSIR